MSRSGELTGGQQLTSVNQRDSLEGALFQRVITSVNTVAASAGVSATGEPATPTAPSSMSVKVSGELAHVTITDNAPLERNTHYFVEFDTTAAFLQPHPVFYGPSRTRDPLNLPTNDDNGNPVTYYFRSYKQQPGSKPSSLCVYGGLANPLGVQMAGSTNLTLLASTGSGTASGNGTQGGQGFGKYQTRQQVAPKRNV